MGADWILDKLKAPPDDDGEFADALAEFRRVPDGDPRLEELGTYLSQHGVSSVDMLGAPRIGVDSEATEWFLETVYKDNLKQIADVKAAGRPVAMEFLAFWTQPLEVILAHHQDMPVVQLALEKDGLPEQPASYLAGPLDFRGEAVIRVASGALAEEARQNHSAEESEQFAERILQAVPQFVGQALSQNVLQSAATWLSFWGSRGFGFTVWM